MECHERFAPITLLVRYPHFSLVNRISRILNCAHALLNTGLNCPLRMLCSGRVTLFLEAWLDMSCTTSKVGCSRSYGQAPFKSQANRVWITMMPPLSTNSICYAGQRAMFDGSTHLVFLAASPGRLEKHQDSGPAIFPELNPEVLNRWVIVKKRPKRWAMARH